MLITYETWFTRLKSAQGPELVLSLGPGAACVIMRTNDFRINYYEGKAEVQLGRNLTKEEMRDLASALVKAADELDKRDQQIGVIVQSSSPNTNVFGSVVTKAG